MWRDHNEVEVVNLTDICLIPKVNKPEFVSQFRPISLCNVTYKIITKVIVNRLKEIVAQVVSPFQTGFVPGRNITENIVIAQEMLHSMVRMRSKVGFFAIKVDLAKAYDRLDWSFLHKVLLEVRVPNELISVIMKCVTSVQSNVLWNGARSEYFQPQCGIRQGDPMSPYLFVLSMDKLSHIIADAIEDGNWKPMRAGRNGPQISHLMFADDVILFGQATTENMEAVLEVLQTFCAMSGQRVNYDKSSIFFSRNVEANTRHALSAKSGLKETTRLGNYLGVPALGRTPRCQDFQYLIEKIKGRLAGWKAKQLSLAGRITLAKSVIQSIPVYPMMSMPIPKSCLNEIEKLQRSFIWGDGEDKRKTHMVGWDTMTKPKQCGGMGFRKLQAMNEACLMKMGWSLMVGENSLWGQVLLGKYGRESWNQGKVTTGIGDSALWKAIVKSWPNLEEHRVWSIRDGRQVSFWKDKWLDDGLRLIDYGNDVSDDIKDWKVQDVVTATGEWNFAMLQQVLPHDILKKLHAIVIPHTDSGNDVPMWPGDRMGYFTVKAAYQLLTGDYYATTDIIWKKLWKLEVMERVRVFIWQMMHGRLLTKTMTARWNFGNSFCDNCSQFEETISHVVRDCLIAMQTWNHFVAAQHRGIFFCSRYSGLV
jgi:hypothetical protein